MNHEQLLAETTCLADGLGVWWLHLPQRFYGRGNWKGFPDLLLLGEGGLLFAELKTGSTLEPAQIRWRYRLQAVGAEWRLWQPVDLLTGTIRAELEHIARPR